MVLIIALLITRLMQQHMRKYLQENDIIVEGLKKSIKTKRPTLYAMTWTFTNIEVLLIQDMRILKSVLSENQLKYLAALGLDERVYTDPASRPKKRPPESRLSKNKQQTDPLHRDRKTIGLSIQVATPYFPKGKPVVSDRNEGVIATDPLCCQGKINPFALCLLTYPSCFL